MDGHQKIELPLDKLLVNPENYRFDPVKDQQEAMLTMLQSLNNKIIKLARDIALHGLNPSRRLLVKKTGGKYVILDGNRRITVLKLMTNPNEISGDYLFKSIFELIHAKYKDSLPKVVECAAYPEDQQNIADSWVLLEHTGENQGMGTVPWDSEQKHRFEAHHKKQELPRTLQVLDFLETNGIITEGVEATNLERLLGTRGVAQMLGIDFPKKEKFILIESREEVLRRLKKVVDGMSTADFNVGKIYTLNQRLAWIRDILAPQPAAPKPSQGANTPPPVSSNSNTNAPFPNPVPIPSSSVSTNTSQTTTLSGILNTSTPQPSPTPASTTAPASVASVSASMSVSNPVSASNPNPNASTSTPAPAPPTPQAVSSSTTSYQTLINPANPSPATSSTKVVEVYKELQIVSLSGQRAAPDAVGALLRILIEITAQEYLMRKQNFGYDKDDLRNPKENNKAYSDLPSKLNYIITGCGLPAHVANVLRVLVKDQLVITTLNQVMHNNLFSADAAAIRGLWKNFEKVFDYLVSEMK